MIIGITGKIGAGKSVSSKYIISKYNYDYINEDEISHKLLNNNTVKEVLIKEFGNDILDDNKLINRSILKKLINEKNINILNNVMHPLVFDYVKRRIDKCKNSILIETALPLEARLDELCDLIIVIERDYYKRKEELIKQRKIDSNYFEFFNSIQNTNINFKNMYIIDNNETLDELYKKIDRILVV